MATNNPTFTAESLKACRLTDIAHLMNNLEQHRAELLRDRDALMAQNAAMLAALRNIAVLPVSERADPAGPAARAQSIARNAIAQVKE